MPQCLQRLVRALAVLALAGLLAGCGDGALPTETKPRVGYLAPDFELSDLNGQPVKLSDYRGNVIVLNFWATWCGPCRLELPTLKSVWENRPAGLLVVGVSTGEASNIVASFARQNSLSYALLLDPVLRAANAFEIGSIPTTFVIDRDGVIRYRRRGILIPGELDLAIKALLP